MQKKYKLYIILIETVLLCRMQLLFDVQRAFSAYTYQSIDAPNYSETIWALLDCIEQQFNSNLYGEFLHIQ